MKKKSILLIIVLSLLILGIIIFSFFSKKENISVLPEIQNKEKIDWNTIIIPTFYGYEDQASMELNYNTIPGLKEKAEEKINSLKIERDKIVDSQKENEIKEISEKINKLRELSFGNNLCRFEENPHIKNGDKIKLDCSNPYLKELGYSFSESQEITVSGLLVVEPEVDYEPVENTKPIEINIEKQKTFYNKIGDILVVTTEEFSEIKNDTFDNYASVAIIVANNDDLQSAIKYAKSDSRISSVSFGNTTYTARNNFENPDIFRGFSAGGLDNEE